jgi:hypothetical protein
MWPLSKIETDISHAISGLGPLTVTENRGSSGIIKERSVVVTFKWTEDTVLDGSVDWALGLAVQGSRV